MSRTRAVGIREVAAAAGVSRQTVSRVLNLHPNVAPPTRLRVLDAMRQLDYIAHNGARSMRSRRSRVVGVHVTGHQSDETLAALASIEAAARERRLWTMVAFAPDDDTGVDALAHLRDASVDSLVLVFPHHALLRSVTLRTIGISWSVVE